MNIKYRHTFSPKKKDRMKIIRSIIEGCLLLAIVAVIIRALPNKDYVPVNDQNIIQSDKGFIALSYFGVDRTGDQKLISTDRLDEQLKALKESGYVTITQQDILDYYTKGTKLPAKSLFLMFEDGRKDTAIFAQKIMEQYNYKATMCSYAENLNNYDSKYLKPQDLRNLEKTSYWELGTNGYRLSYINVFDRFGNFLNQLDTYQFSSLAPYLDRNYDHYLMDYIRDQNGVPMEDMTQMKKRIAYDYTAAKDIYTKAVGKLPYMYILMHSNTGKFGTNNNVSTENGKWITSLFKMNFNREGNSSNVKGSSIYDLTRLEPQPYWYPNHLLMRIWSDTKQNLNFVSGDLKRKAFWNTVLGESQFVKDAIVLTSLPNDRGLMELKNSNDYKDISLSTELKGNKKGSQMVYLRADEDLESYLSCQIKDNELYLYEKEKGKPQKQLYSLNLRILDSISYQSVEANKLEAEIKELETSIKYTRDTGQVKELTKQLMEKEQMKARTVQEGADAEIPKIGISEPGDRLVEIGLTGNRMTVYLDKKPIVKDLEVHKTTAGHIFLEAAFSGDGYSQSNLEDNVYDGVFKDLLIKKITDSTKTSEIILYNNQLSGLDKAFDKIDSGWNDLINWSIKTL
ncbi:glycoside hydrolase [Desulfosporosinus sp. SYSU MS00001]|uniref:glycoside hydrolase n=1 Tax=Desulfosporosinus sp. SYSU MS00001 TaxID=3416284 RepID=UPI003CF26208